MGSARKQTENNPTNQPNTCKRLAQESHPELTDGLSATACFQMSSQLQSQISSCQTIMGWQSRCHLPMHPPRGPGLWSMPPAIVSHPAFNTLMTAQIQTFLHANPVTTTLSRAARWDQLKVHIQDVARGYCFTSTPSVQGSSGCSGYEPARLARPM